jgi:multidrug resistance efflux pump
MATEAHPASAAPGRRTDGTPDDAALDLHDDRSGLPAMLLVEDRRRLGPLRRLIPLGVVLALGFVAFMPWQQSVSGMGRVIAFDPLDRRVNVEARVPGVVRKSNIVEGQRVRAGDVLVELEDNDPNLLVNLRRQREDAGRRRGSLASRTNELTSQVRQQELSLQAALVAARERINAADISARIAQLRYDRIRDLFMDNRGLASQQELELAELSQKSTAADLASARANLALQEATLTGAIANTRSLRDSAEAELAAADQLITALDIQVAQASRQVVVAPRDGIVFSVQATPGSYLVPRAPICVIIPETESRMIELWLDGNDMPLATPRETGADGVVLRPGSDVRVQFEGWPAVAIIGPFRAPRGTFGGEVVFVDATDNGKGRFRVVVAPKPDTVMLDGKPQPEDWPDRAVLRQGVRAQGWVLSAQVPLWYEAWRRVNGFPATPTEDYGNAGKK